MHPTRRLGYVTAIIATIVMMAGASAPSPFYPDIAAQLHLPPFGITVVFAVYALTLLLALLILGSLSDLVGRRPVISVGFVILAASLFTFWHADSFAMLILARAIQGVATGVLMSTLSATVVDFEPPQQPGSAATWNSVGAMVGLASGAITAGILLDVTPDAKLFTFGALIALYLVVAVVIWFVPDTSPKSGTFRSTVRPRIVAPRTVRPLLLMSVPAVIAGWATGGLFLALVPSLVRVEFGITEHVIQGATIAALAGSGGIAAFVIRNRSARFITNFGTLCLAIGTALSLVALLLSSFWGYIAAVVVVGAGFGTAFGGVLRSVLPAVEPTHRAGTLSTVFIIAYLAFGVPSMLAGLSVPLLGLTPTMVTFGSIVVVLAATATVLRVRSAH